MQFNRERVRANVRAASTDDLLDRATVWREGMVPEALDMIESELRDRGVKLTEVEEHARRRAGEAAARPDGSGAVCYRCDEPAVERRWVWWRFLRLLPLVPVRVRVCPAHRRDWSLTSLPRPGRRPPA
jgi:hypothetical protein